MSRLRRLKVVLIKTHGIGAEALLDSGAVPTLISEKLCEELLLMFDEKIIRQINAAGQKAHLIEKVINVLILPDHLSYPWISLL